MRKKIFALAMLASLINNTWSMDISAIESYLMENNVEDEQIVSVVLGKSSRCSAANEVAELKSFVRRIPIEDDTSVVVEIKSSDVHSLKKLECFENGMLLITQGDSGNFPPEQLAGEGHKKNRVLISFKERPPLFKINEDGTFEKISRNIAKATQNIPANYVGKVNKKDVSEFSLLDKYEIELTVDQLKESLNDKSIYLTNFEGKQKSTPFSGLKLSKKIVEEASEDAPINYTIKLITPEDYGFASQYYNLEDSIEQDRIFSDTLSSLLEKYIPGKSKELLSTTAGFGLIPLTRNELLLLIRSNDPRLSVIDHNKIKTSSAMNIVTGSGPGGVALAQTWSGNSGGNAWIAILDSGVTLRYPEFSSTYRQYVQGCYGTTDFTRGLTSTCKNMNSMGDTSTLINDRFGGYSDTCVAGATIGGVAPVDIVSCNHGNVVASVALGNNISSCSGCSDFKGISYSSNIIAMNISTLQYDPAKNLRVPRAFSEDFIAALSAIRSMALSKKIVVNISQQSDQIYNQTCNSADPQFAALVQQLKNQYNTPTIIATGNAGSKYGVSWPACMTDAIKVAATDKFSGALATYSNIAPQNSPVFQNQTVWLAPGGSGLYVQTEGTVKIGYQGTSFAAPVVAGVYALVRSAVDSTVTVNAVTQFLNDFYPNRLVSVDFGPTNTNSTFKSIRLSN